VKRPALHLWLYNHFLHGVSDQVSFFVQVFSQHGYRVSLGRRPCRSSLNVVIENFSSESRDILLEFCRLARKRVAVIMTEHVDFEQGQIFFHGTPLGSENDYIHPVTALARVQNLLECLPYIRCMFVLGDLPELRNMSNMLPGLDVRSIPFPEIRPVARTEFDPSSEPINSFVFTGGMTGYRKKILSILESESLSVKCPKAYVSRRRRNALNKTGKLILNIPQSDGWRWLSLMRIVAGLQVGRATISIGTHDDSRIASSCTQIDIRSARWIDDIRQCLVDWKALYLRDLERYSCMIKSFEQEHPFPHDMLEYWSMTDSVEC
jgi:hypothetical protein